MKYILYDENNVRQFRAESVYELRKFLCDRKYSLDCDKDIGDTFDYICLLYTSPSPRDP